MMNDVNFAIDSDDEEDNNNNNAANGAAPRQVIDIHPLQDDFLKQPSATTAPQQPQQEPQPPPQQQQLSHHQQQPTVMQQQQQQPPRQVPGSVQPGVAATAAASSLLNSMSALTVGGPMSSNRSGGVGVNVAPSPPAAPGISPRPTPVMMPTSTQSYPQHPHPVQPHHPNNNNTTAMIPPHHQHQHFPGTATTPVTTTPPSSSGAPSLDVFKAQTSRFASNIANMAQRAATHVATAAGQATTPVGGGGTVVSAPPLMVPQHQPHHVSMGAGGAQQQQQQGIVSVEIDNEQKMKLISKHVGTLLPGESVIMFVTNLLHVSDSTGFQYGYATYPSTMWCCVMTFYRLILFGTNDVVPPTRPTGWNYSCWPSDSAMPSAILQMPLASMDKVEKSVFTSTPDGVGSNPTTLMGLLIHGKDNGRQIRFTTPSYSDALRAYEALQNYAFPGRRNLGSFFAFESKRAEVTASVQTDPETGKKLITLEPLPKRFSAVQEYHRQFARGGTMDTEGSRNDASRPWSIWKTINQSYQLCGSYPSVLVGPSAFDENNPESQRIIRQCAAFRSESRLPSLTWSSGIDGASLWRGSQPKVGLQGTRSSADELMLKQIMESATGANIMGTNNLTPDKQQQNLYSGFMSISPSMVAQLTGTIDIQNWMPEPTCGLKIMDLRPRSAAMANRTSGYGYENTSHYPGTTLQFCNIGNIHAVRDSYQKISALCHSPTTSDLQWNALVEDTKWLSHIRLILAAGWEAAFWIHVHRLPVLLHCSHGWDRTSQVAVIAQLILDDHYRTREGFATLVEKDFMSFGHPFHLRSAHGEGRGNDGGAGGAGGGSSGGGGSGSSTDEGQISPIFIQFLDCVFQIVRQYPECFEFNTKYLLIISEYVYSCRFGNFLCDTERDRELAAFVRQRTHSLWDYLESREDTINRQFDKSNSGKGVMLMPLPTLLRNVSLWTDRHCMHGPKPTTRWLPQGITRPRCEKVANDQQGNLVTVGENERLLNSMASVVDNATASTANGEQR